MRVSVREKTLKADEFRSDLGMPAGTMRHGQFGAITEKEIESFGQSLVWLKNGHRKGHGTTFLSLGWIYEFVVLMEMYRLGLIRSDFSKYELSEK